jgi:hypothetical protein
MAVYTSFDMIADCQAGKAQGWIYFADEMIAPLRWLYARYGLGKEALQAKVVELKKEIREYAPMVQREFIAALRPHPAPKPNPGIELSTLATALQDLTIVERQIVWFDTMGYGIPDTARLMRLSEETAAGARERAAEALRKALDDWSVSLLRDNGASLGAQARAAVPEEKVSFRDYLNIIDGRMTWHDRAGVELKLKASWHEIDQFCRVREADAAVMESQKPPRSEADAWLTLLGVERPRPGFWKRLLGA